MPRLAARMTARYSMRVDWDFYRHGENVLYWHWSPHHGWAMNHTIRGWNETLIVYVLAAGASRHAIDPVVYEQGFCTSAQYRNGNEYHGVRLPLGPDLGGPLFFAHYSFLGLDPHNLADRHTNYWLQNSAQVTINRAHCIVNPGGFKGYGPACWGLTASDDPGGYDAHAPNNDNGTISPTAALSSFPYAPESCFATLRHFLSVQGEKIWGRFGFTDAFNETRDWWADTYLYFDRSGADCGDDGELPQRTFVEAVHGGARGAGGDWRVWGSRGHLRCEQSGALDRAGMGPRRSDDAEKHFAREHPSRSARVSGR